MRVGIPGKTAFLLVIAATASMASTVFSQGIFPADDYVDLYQFTLNASGVVTFQSYGYAGGVADSTTVPAGGFAPEATIFALVGTDYVEATSDNGGHCGTTGQDSVTGNCDDPYIQTTLDAGTYYLALSVQDNLTVDGFLADGFNQAGNPGFTCAEGGMTGQFCDVTDALFVPRTGNFAFTFSGASSLTNVNTPEPATGWSVLPGILLGALTLRRKSD